MRFLMLCTKYPLDPNDRYLTNELAGALAAKNHSVQVVVIDWAAPYGAEPKRHRSADGVDILALAPRAIRGLGRFIETATKWTLSSIAALLAMRRAIGKEQFDAVIAFTPCVTMAAPLWWARRRVQGRSLLFIHDFFPYHHHAIGLVPTGIVFRAALALEKRLIHGFDVIGCNWPGNITYLHRHYRIRPEQRVIWTPLWTDITLLGSVIPRDQRVRYGLPQDGRIAVFGGQITTGRGVEEILQVADLARDRYPDLIFLFIGDGRLVPLVEAKMASGLINVQHRRRVAREDYLALLGACDLGIVSTVKEVDSFSFPTKTLDYLRAGLPIAAAVEEESDYRAFLDRWSIGVSVPAGNPQALFAAIQSLLNDPRPADIRRRQARSCLEAIFDVKGAAERVVLAIDGAPNPEPPW